MKKLVISGNECTYIETNETITISREALIAEKKALLRKYKYDVEQVDLFGMARTDYTEKKALCAQLVAELKELEKNP